MWHHQLYLGHRVRAALRRCTLLQRDAFNWCFEAFGQQANHNRPRARAMFNTSCDFFSLTRTKTEDCGTRPIDWRVRREGPLFSDPSFLFHGNHHWARNCHKLSCLTGMRWCIKHKHFPSVHYFGLHACALPFTFPPNHLLSPLFTSCCSLRSNIDRGQEQSKVTPSQFLMYNIVPQMVFPPL